MPLASLLLLAGRDFPMKSLGRTSIAAAVVACEPHEPSYCVRREVMAQVSGHDGRGSDSRTSNRGFASMNSERQRQIASMGGKAVPDEKRSFSQNRRLAAEAGRKGGQSVPGAKRSFSQNRELAATAGRKGGQSVPDEKRSFSQNPELAAEAGRKGGQASHGGGSTETHRGDSRS
jgi:general stress protein YciG